MQMKKAKECGLDGKSEGKESAGDNKARDIFRRSTISGYNWSSRISRFVYLG